MQRNDPVERVRHQFRLQQLHLRLHGPAPELPVQVLPAARIAGAIFKPRWVADRVDEQAIACSQLRLALQHVQELDERVYSLWLVTMKPGKEIGRASWRGRRSAS